MNKFTKSAALIALALTVGVTSANAAVVAGRGRASTPSATMGSSTADCKGDMGMLFRVHAKVIKSMKDQVVHLAPICEDLSLGDSGDIGTLFSDGNVTGLRSIIGNNRLLASTLGKRDYSEDDVVGIRLNKFSNEVILYVHKHNR